MKLLTEALNVYLGIFISPSFVETYQMVFSNKVWKVRVIFLCFRKSLYVPTKNVEIILGPFLLPAIVLTLTLCWVYASTSRRLRCWLRIHRAFIWFYSRIKSHQCTTCLLKYWPPFFHFWLFSLLVPTVFAFPLSLSGIVACPDKKRTLQRLVVFYFD